MAHLFRNSFVLGVVFCTAVTLLIGGAALNNIRVGSRALTTQFEKDASRTVTGIVAGLRSLAPDAASGLAGPLAPYIAAPGNVLAVSILTEDSSVLFSFGTTQGVPLARVLVIERDLAVPIEQRAILTISFDRTQLNADIAQIRKATYQRAPIVWAGVMFMVIALLAYRERTRRATGDNRRLRDEIRRRSEAEERERAIRARLEDIASLTSDFYWETDADGMIRYVSDRFREITGALDEYIIGRPIGFGRWVPAPETIAKVAEVIDGRKTLRNAYFHYTDTKGKPRVIAASAAPRFDTDGAYIGHRGTSRDVTSEFEANQRIAISEERFRSIAEMSADLFWETDTDGRIAFFVPRPDSRLSMDPEAFLGTDFRELILQFSPDALEEFERVMKAHLPFSGLRQDGHGPDGQPLHLVANGRPIVAADGTFLGYRGATRDVTQLVLAEKQAVRSTRRAETYLDNAPAAIILKDRDLRFTHVNGTYTEWSGRSLDSLVGKTIPDVYGHTEESKVHQEIDRCVRDSGVARRDEETFTFSDGVERHISTIRFPITDDDGTVAGVGTFLTDITEQYRAREAAADMSRQLSEFLKNSPSAIAIKDIGGHFSQVNPAWCALLGKAAADVIGKTNAEVFPNGPARSWLRTQDEKVVDATAPIVGEAEIQAGDGTLRRISSVRYPLLDKNGKATHIASISTDVTQARNAEDRLRQTHRLEAIGQLTGGVAHDFNNLLTVAQGNLELLEMSLSDEGQHKRLDAAIRAIKRGGSLTQQLLSFARKQTLAPMSISVAEAVNQIGTMISRVLRENIVLHVDIANDLPHIHADPAQLESALLNLALNAQDAMPRGGGLTLRAYRDSVRNDRVKLSVSDTGTGIPEDILGRVLEPFFTTKKVGEGSGLGLSMVYGFVQQSGGDLDIQSDLGRGTQIVLSMPIASTPLASEELDKPFLAGKGRVLFVEDDPELREMAEQMIRALGYVVEAVPDAEIAAQRLVQKTPYNILLTDLVLPGQTSGRQLAEFARGIRPDLHIVITSGYADSVLKAEGDLPAGSLFLPKPFRMAALSQVLGHETA